MLAVSAVFLYIPIALMLILYCIIIVTLKKKKLPGEQSLKAEKQHQKKQEGAQNGDCYCFRVCHMLDSSQCL